MQIFGIKFGKCEGCGKSKMLILYNSGTYDYGFSAMLCEMCGNRRDIEVTVEEKRLKVVKKARR